MNQSHKRPRAVVLLSGGLDSATAAAMALTEGYQVYAMSIRYNQRHSIELESAARVARALDLTEHMVIDVDLGSIGGSALTDQIEVPKGRTEDEIASGIPATYVPARNTIFLSLALAWAEVLGSQDIFIGVNALDYSGYPDCRPEYIEAFEKMARLATKAAIEGGSTLRVRTPLIAMTKAEIIKRGVALGVDYSVTHSCYDPELSGLACGRCDSCRLRLSGFAEAGLVDPLAYALR